MFPNSIRKVNGNTLSEKAEYHLMSMSYHKFESCDMPYLNLTETISVKFKACTPLHVEHDIPRFPLATK